MTPRLRALVPTLALTALAGAGAVLLGLPARHGPPPARPPATARPAPWRPPETAPALLARATELRLTTAQRAELEALDLRFRRETADLEAAVEKARADFADFMQANPTRSASLAEIQARAAEYRDLSAQLREQRERHAREALAILTQSQRHDLAAIPATGGTR